MHICVGEKTAMNEAEQFVANRVDAELKVSDITQHVKANVPLPRKAKKVPTLVEYFTARKTDLENLEKEGRQAAHVDHTLPPSITSFISDLKARARAERHGGSFAKLPPNDKKEQMKQLRRRCDEKMLLRETVELQLRGLKTELAACERARWDKNAEIAGKADSTKKALKERQIPRVEQPLRRAKEDEDNAVRDLRNARDTPMLGGLQKVSRGSAEDRG